MKSAVVKMLIAVVAPLVGLSAVSGELTQGEESSARCHTPKGVARAAYAGQAPFVDALGGLWTLRDGNGVQLSTPVTKSLAGTLSLVGVCSSATPQPHITERPSDDGAEEAEGPDLACGELAVHPYNDNGASVCYQASRTGFCDLSLSTRSLSQDTSYDIVIEIYVAGACLSAVTYRRTKAYQVYPRLEKNGILIFSGQEIEVRVSAGSMGPELWHHSDDWTAVKVAVTDTEDVAAAYDAWQAVHDEIAANGPARQVSFTDAGGCGWALGRAYVSYGGQRTISRTMTIMDEPVDRTMSVTEPALGWHAVSPAGNPLYDLDVYVNLPRFLCYEGSSKSVTFAGMPNYEGYIAPRELYTHPNSAMASVIRFTAAKGGVYQVMASFRDLCDTSYASGSGRIRSHVSGWLYVDSGPLCSPQTTGSLVETKQVKATDVYLRKGETVDFAIAPESARAVHSDGTAFQFRLVPLANRSEDVVSVDITSGETFAGRGRVGYGTKWNRLSVADGVTAVETRPLSSWSAEGTKERKRAKFRLSRISGLLVAAGDAFLKNGVVSESADDAYAFSFDGFKARSSVRLYLYGRGPASFAVNGTEQAVNRSWFDETAPDYAVVETTADETGTVSGVFRADGSARATFCGLQAVSSGFLGDGLCVFVR